MSKQTINIGASPNDGTGTPLRTSFDYTNQNFTELYTALGGGVGLPGATTQVIFNDGGTNLAGDAGLVYNKTTDALTVAGLVTAGSATITGDLTVDTGTLKVDSTNNRVIVGHTSGASPFQVSNAGGAGFEVQPTGVNSAPAILSYNRSGAAWIQLTYGASSHVWQNSGTDAMTLNSTGLAIGDTAFSGTRLTLRESATNPNALAMTNRNATQTWRIGVDVAAVDDKILGFYDSTSATFRMQLTDTGNLGIGKTPSARLDVASARAASVVGGIIGTTGTGVVADECQFLIKNVNTASGQNNGAGIGGLLEASASNKSSLLFYVDNGTAVTNCGRFDSNGNLILQSSATPATLATNGQLTVNATSNTNLRFSYRGSDGTTRVANITLA